MARFKIDFLDKETQQSVIGSCNLVAKLKTTTSDAENGNYNKRYTISKENDFGIIEIEEDYLSQYNDTQFNLYATKLLPSGFYKVEKS